MYAMADLDVLEGRRTCCLCRDRTPNRPVDGLVTRSAKHTMYAASVLTHLAIVTGCPNIHAVIHGPFYYSSFYYYTNAFVNFIY